MEEIAVKRSRVEAQERWHCLSLQRINASTLHPFNPPLLQSFKAKP
jgi:hypothetical protein